MWCHVSHVMSCDAMWWPVRIECMCSVAWINFPLPLPPSRLPPPPSPSLASLLKGLKHANIVTLHDIIHTPTNLTFVFEYVVSTRLPALAYCWFYWSRRDHGFFGVLPRDQLSRNQLPTKSTIDLCMNECTNEQVHLRSWLWHAWKALSSFWFHGKLIYWELI